MSKSLERRECPDCETQTCEQSMRIQRFEYGKGADYKVLSVLVPVWTCTTCACAFTDGDSEALRTEAVRKHLARVDS